ncbi:MAG: hypothetical protein KGH69_04990 [Candidatus Micrarchaeota archaeon]|nr:hypothetical protein [Candidatus Micrarchaeota archaeon]
MGYGFIVPALFVGMFMAFMSAMIPNLSAFLVGAAWYGLPASWLVKMVVAPQYNPWRIEYVAFMVDVAFWFAVTATVMLIRENLVRKLE